MLPIAFSGLVGFAKFRKFMFISNADCQMKVFQRFLNSCFKANSWLRVGTIKVLVRCRWVCCSFYAFLLIFLSESLVLTDFLTTFIFLCRRSITAIEKWRQWRDLRSVDRDVLSTTTTLRLSETTWSISLELLPVSEMLLPVPEMPPPLVKMRLPILAEIDRVSKLGLMFTLRRIYRQLQIVKST